MPTLVADAGFGISQAASGRQSSARAPRRSWRLWALSPASPSSAPICRALARRLIKLHWVARRRSEAPLSRRHRRAHRGEAALRPWQSSERGFMSWSAPAASSPTRTSSQFANLPLLARRRRAAAAADIRRCGRAASRDRGARPGLSVSVRTALEPLLDDGVIVKLPETGWQKELDALEHLIVDKGILERDLTEIDLRSPSAIFLRARKPARRRTKTERGNAI